MSADLIKEPKRRFAPWLIDPMRKNKSTYVIREIRQTPGLGSVEP